MTSRDQRRASLAFAAVTSLFFAWGFITSNNDPLIVALRSAFSLNYAEALLTQIVFFLAYGLLSLPAAWLGSRLGPLNMVSWSLLLMGAGCIAVVISTGFNSFPLVLSGLFVLAAGFTALQVASNPLAAELGPPEGRHFRLNLAQSFNSLGVVLGVHFGSIAMLGDPVLRGAARGPVSTEGRAELLGAVDRAFLIMAGLLAVVWIMWNALRRLIAPSLPSQSQPPARMFAAFGSRWAIFGAIAIGLYVGAEVSIGSIMINFLNQREILNLPLESAGGHLANFYWGGALVGRLIGTVLLMRVRAPVLLAACGVAATGLCATVLFSSGQVAGYSALAIGLFNSIMFPTIFSITLERSGVSQSATSGLLCVAIFGGGILPLAVGMIADRLGLSLSFIVPLIAYAFILAFALTAFTRTSLTAASPRISPST